MLQCPLSSAAPIGTVSLEFRGFLTRPHQNPRQFTYLKSDRARDDEEWEGDDKRKHRSSKSRRIGNGEEADGLDSSGRRRSNGDRNESRKKVKWLEQGGK
ncbi:hypothetical protein F0562_031212 [Nyssa sinensis]|uniref:Uncharacterized protein n=1 Tax=Nyssa sinensis TaxID=561372 RepID=A0A5J5ARI4_9ASTE|nr:hypothetical protein F0562_031212 [Nyssa sinensis]